MAGSKLGTGGNLEWLRSHVSHRGDECLIWPFSRNHQGYGQIGYYRKMRKAHRIMCILAHGEPPSPRHHAAHSCGGGSRGCVNPNHLEWKTPKENRLEANEHGTGNRPSPRRLTIDQVEEIRASDAGYIGLAEKYGVYFGTIAKIKRGETWKTPRSTLTSDQIVAIKGLDAKGMSPTDISKSIGVNPSAVRRLVRGQSFRGA